MCEKSLGVSSSLNKMAAATAAPLQSSAVVRMFVASQLFDTMNGSIFWSY